MKHEGDIVTILGMAEHHPPTDRSDAMTTDHCGAMQVKAWELLPGDRILGMSCEVVDGPRYSQGDIGGDRERQRYTYTLSNGREITYVADGPGPRVLRSEVK